METLPTTDKLDLLELKNRIANAEAADKVRRIAQENKKSRKRFDKKAHEEIIKNHPVFSILHLLNDSED